VVEISANLLAKTYSHAQLRGTVLLVQIFFMGGSGYKGSTHPTWIASRDYISSETIDKLASMQYAQRSRYERGMLDLKI
jgi:hypothetical protein